jgi:NACHT domain
MIDLHYRSEPNLFKLLPIAKEAAFNSYNKRDDLICLQDTRVDVLAEIYAWADGYGDQCIFWLNGIAGTGKSTIARTIADYYYQQDRLGASFFFSRGGGDVGHADKFFTTIAWQLAKRLPMLKSDICRVLKEHQDVATQTPRDQWSQLIRGPLSRLNGHSVPLPLVLVIDALDECDGENDVQRILQLLAEARGLDTVRLRIFMTSRAETPIRHGFCRMPETQHQDLILHNISPSIVEHDIFVFLEHHLRVISQEYFLGIDWPAKQIIDSLVWKTGGLFVWAATACRFIRGGRQFAAKRLTQILQDDTAVASPEDKLNEIYKVILTNCIRDEYDDTERAEWCQKFKDVVGTIIILLSPLSTFSLSRLLRISSSDTISMLDDMHSILKIPRDQAQPIHLHHPSFRDFLLSERRCGHQHFLVEERKAHEMLTECCIQLMSTGLKRDICGLRQLGTLTKDVQRSQIEQYLPAELRYACLHWIQHLQKSSALLTDDDQVHCFLQKHLLHWLEALSLMGNTSEGVVLISSLNGMIIVSNLESVSKGFPANLSRVTKVTACKHSSIMLDDLRYTIDQL